VSAEQFLLLATGVHLGFQAVVTIVVYPGLVDLAPDDWERGHAAHTHRMVIVVIPVYAALFIALGWALATAIFSTALIVTTVAVLIVGMTTALVAAPIHHPPSIVDWRTNSQTHPQPSARRHLSTDWCSSRLRRSTLRLRHETVPVSTDGRDLVHITRPWNLWSCRR
jgi:small-conductance mechanosensitive channel